MRSPEFSKIYDLGYRGQLYSNPYKVGSAEYQEWDRAYKQGVAAYQKWYAERLVLEMQQRISLWDDGKK